VPTLTTAADDYAGDPYGLGSTVMPDDRVALNAPGAPPAVGPYSHGVKHGGLTVAASSDEETLK